MHKKITLKLSEEKQKEIYKTLFKKHQISHKSLHWINQKNQLKRFEVLIKPFDLNNQKILDIGSGFGDFFVFLKDKNIKAKMVGYEIVEEFLTISRKRCPYALFKPINLSRSSPNEEFDFVFSSGVFAFGNRVFFETMIKNAFACTNKVYAFNIYSPTYDERFLKLSTEEIKDFLHTLNPSFIKIEKNYIENDTTFFVFK